jgi:hypothetical protein
MFFSVPLWLMVLLHSIHPLGERLMFVNLLFFSMYLLFSTQSTEVFRFNPLPSGEGGAERRVRAGAPEAHIEGKHRTSEQEVGGQSCPTSGRRIRDFTQ